MRRQIFVLLLVAVTGCITDFDDEIASTSDAVSTQNRLTLNRLTLNRLTLNRLTLNSLASDGLENTVEGRELLEYVIRCALPAHTTVVAEVDGAVYEFPGRLGLAPNWLSSALSKRGSGLVSACLLAHVNAFDVSVPLSARAAGLAVTGAERTAYPIYEATFFGDVFADAPELYGCTGDDPEEALENSPYRALRVCADALDGAPGPSACEFGAVGPCADVCERELPNFGWDHCWTEPGQHGQFFEQGVSSWLRSHNSE